MENNTISDVLKLTEEALTPFKYHDDVICDEKHYKMPDKQDVIFSYNANYFNVSDLHIVNIIAKLHFTTMEAIVETINYLIKSKKLNGKVTSDTDLIKSRVNVLVKSGLIKRYKFYPYKNKVMGHDTLSSYYLVTSHGYNFLKRILNYRDSYDEYLAITPIEDVFKFLSANIVINNAFKYSSFKGFQNNEKHFIKSTRNVLTTFSSLDFEMNSEKYKLYVEPIKLTCNEQRLSKEELKEEIIMRLGFLKGIITTENDVKKYILLLAEDLEGLRYVSGFVKNYLLDYIDYIYIATDASLYVSGFDHSLIKLTVNDGKVGLVPTKPFFIE